MIELSTSWSTLSNINEQIWPHEQTQFGPHDRNFDLMKNCNFNLMKFDLMIISLFTYGTAILLNILYYCISFWLSGNENSETNLMKIETTNGHYNKNNIAGVLSMYFKKCSNKVNIIRLRKTAKMNLFCNSNLWVFSLLFFK